MNSTTNKIAICCTLALGAGLWGAMAQKFNAEDQLSYEPNVACMKGSPYGKILALAMQGPIDFYWHEGSTHEDEAVLKAEHKDDESCADGCDDHTGHDHAQANSEHGENCGCGAHGEEESILVTRIEQPLHKRAKLQIKKMAASAHRRTNGQPISEAHKKYLQGVTEDKLRLAYELDPSNYTNYGNYHLFIATTTFGKEKADDSKAVRLARHTLEYCKKDNVDPASWITAGSAAYNIIFHIGRYYKQFTVSEAKESLADFDLCISEYVRLRQDALESGRIVSEKRLNEMEARVKYLGKLRQAQGVYMKRIMSTKMARN